MKKEGILKEENNYNNIIEIDNKNFFIGQTTNSDKNNFNFLNKTFDMEQSYNIKDNSTKIDSNSPNFVIYDKPAYLIIKENINNFSEFDNSNNLNKNEILYDENYLNNSFKFEPSDNDFFPYNRVVEKFVITKKQKKLGRKRKDDETEAIHTKYSIDNGTSKLIIECMRNINHYINKIIESLKLLNCEELYLPNLSKSLQVNVEVKKKFLQNKIKTYYENLSKAKHCLEENKNNYIKSNREIIKKLSELNEQKINLLFEIPFNIYLSAFLNDETNIIYNNEIIELDGNFKTLKDCFNEGKDYYSEEEKNNYKNYLEKLMNGKIYPREKRNFKK